MRWCGCPRPIKLRQRGSDGKWFLWEQYLLTGVRKPKAADSWARYRFAYRVV
ncbi:MAG: DUF6935 domain-containing protein [Kineothrix sp.]